MPTPLPTHPYPGRPDGPTGRKPAMTDPMDTRRPCPAPPTAPAAIQRASSPAEPIPARFRAGTASRQTDPRRPPHDSSAPSRAPSWPSTVRVKGLVSAWRSASEVFRSARSAWGTRCIFSASASPLPSRRDTADRDCGHPPRPGGDCKPRPRNSPGPGERCNSGGGQYLRVTTGMNGITFSSLLAASRRGGCTAARADAMGITPAGGHLEMRERSRLGDPGLG